ncbi:MAG: UDP-N-acetylglucosamine 2-epimerase (non-hydrolyzing) [Actinobacteria bacterium HGW-Actinobacteria-7]|jgi:UDP-N-acetylglucosamine 2-epimerase (non-hydrolysing)|nr:MAG: UDP-N-acetylglucosamine 2-epimerase (non-hydrolyzing) [Actinobacteria bacterium HGW-Actinobacteria-7]
MRVLVVVGARPNFIKVGPLMPALAGAGIDADLVHTGQHYDALMSDVFFRDLEIPEPAWFLGVGSGTHAVQTGKAMIALEGLMIEHRPDALLVVGDVNSTLAGALAAAKLHIPVVHLEAGLRSGDMSMPEEVNRLVTDQLSSLLLTPTANAEDNLVAEGIGAERIVFVGNIMAESLLRHEQQARARQACTGFGLEAGSYLLATVHRPENTDNERNIEGILAALSDASMPVLFPVHPRTRAVLQQHLDRIENDLVTLVEPVGYLDMLSLIADACLVVTDSGGIQEETCMLDTPCVTVRRNTERQITEEIGSNRLAQANREMIGEAIGQALDAPRGWSRPERWDDQVAQRVVDALSRGIMTLKGE